jgi:hypothetical protein
VQEAKIARVWVKKELKLILSKVKTKTFEYHFFQLFKIYIFSFITVFI